MYDYGSPDDAVAGSNQWRDWPHNLVQAFGLPSSHYNAAMEYATELVDRGGYSSLHFVGHSLGGGEAMAMAAATGRYGAYTVFNSAGLHPRTVGREAFGRLRGTHFQSSWDVLRLGNALTPASVPGVRVPLGWAGFHPMTGVCRRMECFLPR